MKSIFQYLTDHVDLLADSTLNAVLEEVLLLFKKTTHSNATIYTIGNGGSQTTAEHFAADLSLSYHRGGQKIRAHCLGSQVATHTALANDYSYEDAFSKQLENLVKPNDVLVIFSVSGNSQNVISAIRTALNLNIDVVAFYGFDGGGVDKILGIKKIFTPNQVGEYGIIENIHLLICHYLIDALNETH
jgi:phosphoheptose isomerase